MSALFGTWDDNSTVANACALAKRGYRLARQTVLI
jgi:hypothetical protein